MNGPPSFTSIEKRRESPHCGSRGTDLEAKRQTTEDRADFDHPACASELRHGGPDRITYGRFASASGLPPASLSSVCALGG